MRLTLILTCVMLLAAPLAAQAASSSSSSDRDAGEVLTPIKYGATVKGSLDDDTDNIDDDFFDYDAYTFSGKAGDKITIDVASNAFDTYVVLYDPSHKDVADDDDGGEGTNSRLTYTLTSDGVWRFDVLASEDPLSTGAYTLTFNGVAGPPAATNQSSSAQPTPVTYGQTITGKLADGDAVDPDGYVFDMYSFNGKKGDTVVLTVDSSAFDPEVFLMDSSGKAITHDDDGGGGLNARLVYTLDYDGAYRADVISLANKKASGLYTFSIGKQ